MTTHDAPTLGSSTVRSDFPVFDHGMRGKPLAYLDNAATSLKPQCVIDAESHYYQTLSANVHRGVYELSERATAMYDEAREAVARFIGAREAAEIVFTRGTTEGVNLLMRSWGEANIKAGDNIVLTDVEHHANLVPWQFLAEKTGADLRFIPYDLDQHGLDLTVLAELVDERTKLVAVSGMSNVTGYAPDLKAIVAAAHHAGARVLVDGAQLVSHHNVDVTALDADFLVFSGHKMCGPTGIGVFYGKREILENMPPFHYGGAMIVRVSQEKSSFKPAPEKFEAGTPNVAGAIGLKAAIDYLEGFGMDAAARHEEALLRYAIEAVSGTDGVTYYGGPEVAGRGGILSLDLYGKDGDRIHPHDVGTVLDSLGVAVRAGYHCAQPFLKVLGAAGTVRASFYLYNDTSDVDRLVDGLVRAREVFS